jgi:hypothetical protein
MIANDRLPATSVVAPRLAGCADRTRRRLRF